MNKKILKIKVHKKPSWILPKYSIDLKEKGNCGVALLANLDKVPTRDLVKKSLEALVNLTHRSAFCKSKEGVRNQNSKKKIIFNFFSGTYWRRCWNFFCNAS